MADEEETEGAGMYQDLPQNLLAVFEYVELNKPRYINTLREAVAIRSISCWAEARNEVLRMIEWTAVKMKENGIEVQLKKVGEQKLCNGENIPYPPVIFGQLGNDPNKRTILVYGHLDVIAAKVEDGWNTQPFVLTEVHGQLFGRGATDDKGPVLGWINAVEAYRSNNIEIPVNLKFIFEGMGECGSQGLEKLLIDQKEKFLKGTDVVCISDNYWLGRRKPCLTYGLRGLSYFLVEVECASKDLHSGVFGGAVKEAMPDLIWLLNQLTDSNGRILIPKVNDEVLPETNDERGLYKDIEFELDEFKNEIGVNQLRYPDDKIKTLMSRWRYPSLSIHGIQGCFSEPGAKTVIPRKVIGKFSIRLVPNQMPEKVEAAVIEFIKNKWTERNSQNIMKVYTAGDGLPPWTANPRHPSYKAAKAAMHNVYESHPDMIRDGGLMLPVLLFQETTKKNVLLLPMGSSDDAAHDKNEKIDIRNFIEGTKVMASYIWEVGNSKEDFN